MFEKEVIKLLKKEVKEVNLEKPPNSELGDYAFPCFSLAKEKKKNPVEIAEELAKKLKPNKIIGKIKANGPYVNFFVNKSSLAGVILKEVLSKKDSYGSSFSGKGKKALIEHTSINPNASPHVGRARNAIIGDCLARLLKFESYKTEVHYLVNDVGKQIAMLVLGSKNKKVTFNNLLKIYVDFNKRLKNKPELEEDVFETLNKLEKGDKKTVKQFKDIVGVCIKGQSNIFSDFGINYDFFDYESEYLWNKKTDAVLYRLEKTKKIFIDDDNRKVLNQEGFKLAMRTPVLVLTRNDGTSLYPLRDLAYTIDKIKRGADKNIIVLGEDHKLYFQQLSLALSLLNNKAPEVVHYSFVLIQDKGKMSTRKGTVVLLEDLMKEAVVRAKKEINKRKNISKNNLEKTAKTIGYGAVKYSILKVSADKNVLFNWENALNFEGETGPYVQYSHARACSILRKYGKKVSLADFNLLKHEKEAELVKKISDFKEIVSNSLKTLKPHLIATYVGELAKLFNEFYHLCPILREEEKLKKARLVLVDSVRQVLSNGLNLLGIEAPERM